MKNPHGVKPNKYKKREGNGNAISCNPSHGPIFGHYDDEYNYDLDFDFDIFIDDNCNEVDICYIFNDGTKEYECDPQYKKSLFVNTGRPDEENYFSVLDYEVFGIDYENRDNINKLCKHPDIIWECVQTTDISEESLKQVDDDEELLNDLDIIHCNDSAVRVKISNYYLKNSSELLSDTQLVDKIYDNKLRDWLGNDCKWKLIYRASEYGYTAQSFHKYCDSVKGPTLVVIKSSEGWIFGGYTTKSWSGKGIYYDIVDNNHRVQER